MVLHICFTMEKINIWKIYTKLLFKCPNRFCLTAALNFYMRIWYFIYHPVGFLRSTIRSSWISNWKRILTKQNQSATVSFHVQFYSPNISKKSGNSKSECLTIENKNIKFRKALKEICQPRSLCLLSFFQVPISQHFI